MSDDPYPYRQNDKRSLLGRKQRLEVARSFPNRYQPVTLIMKLLYFQLDKF